MAAIDSLDMMWTRKTLEGDELLRLGIGLPSTNMSKEMIDLLALGQAMQLRYMHIGFGSLSCFMALLVIIRVWHDSWRAQRFIVKLRPRRWAFLYDLHPAESFPLVLGFVIMFQELAFVGIQARALSKTFVMNCKNSGSIIFAEIFVLGWFHLTFGLDMTIRSLRPQLTAPRRMLSIFVCTISALVLSTAGWLSTKLQPPGNRCYGDMIFRSIRSAWLGVSLCVIMIPSFLLMAIIIGIRLHRNVHMDQNERIAGTRMVYYLVLAAGLYVVIMPFWIQAISGSFDSHLTSPRVAEFVLFVSGTIIALVHFFLRANAARTAIRPKGTPWEEQRSLRLFGPSDLELLTISSPVPIPELEVNEKLVPCKAISVTQPIDQESVAQLPSAEASSIAIASNAQTVVTNCGWRSHNSFAADALGDSETKDLATLESAVMPTHCRHQASYDVVPSLEGIRLPPTTYRPTKRMAEEHIGHCLFITESAMASQHSDVLLRPRSNSTDSTATFHVGMRFSSTPSTIATFNAASRDLRRDRILRDLDSHEITDPFANKPLPRIGRPPLRRQPSGGGSVVIPTMTTSSSLEKGLEQMPYGPGHGRQWSVASLDVPADYAWLKIGDTTNTTPLQSSIMESSSRPRVLRKGSQRQLAEINRSNLAALEQIGSNSRGRS